MAKAIFHKLFNATDTKRGVSMRISPSDVAQGFPEWVIQMAVKAGAAERVNPKQPTIEPNLTEKGN